MTKIDPELVARIHSNQSILLRTISDALSYDMQIVPVVVAAGVGMGVNTMLSGIGRALFDGRNVEIRCAQIEPSDFDELPVLNRGQIEMRKPRISILQDTVTSEAGSLVVLDEAVHDGGHLLSKILTQTSEQAKGPVVVAIHVRPDEERLALAVIEEAIGIHRAHVPTARLSIDLSEPQPSQPVLVSGGMQQDGAKRCERYMELTIQEPYEQTLRLTVNAKPDQDDDALNETLWNLLNADGSSVFARLEIVDGWLECTTDDLTNA
jgi:hypothetical protein